METLTPLALIREDVVLKTVSFLKVVKGHAERKE